MRAAASGADGSRSEAFQTYREVVGARTLDGRHVRRADEPEAIDLLRRTLTRPVAVAAVDEAAPSHSTWWLAAAAGTGILLTIIGIGIGVPHVVAGSTATAIVGLAALVLGGALLAVVFRHVWRSTRWPGRSGLVVVSLLVAQFVLAPMSLAVLATNRAPMPLGGRSPADVGLTFEDVTFTSADGVRLAAWHVPSRNGAAVILRHGSGSTRADVLDHALVLASHGYGVLMTDARGHGGSGGRAMDLGWHGDEDVAPAIDYLLDAADVTEGRIGIVGLSMGGEEAIGAAAAFADLRCVVAEGVTGRRGEDRLPLRPAGPGRWASALFYAVEDATADLLSDARPPRSLRRAVEAIAPRSVLLIAGGTVEEELVAAQQLRAAAPGTVEVWEVAGAPHIAGLAVAPRAWEERVIGYLDANLRPAGV